MSNDDLLAEQQLKQEMAMDDPTDMLNAAAFRDHPKPTSTTISPRKRKRNELPPPEASPSKRISGTKNATTNSTKAGRAIPTKLGRPSKQRHSINTYPAVQKPRGDIWEPEGTTPQKPSTKPAANTKMQMKKKAEPKKAANTSVAEPSVRLTRSLRNTTTKSASAAVEAEGSGSAVLNGRINTSTAHPRSAGRAKGYKKGPGRGRGRPGKQATQEAAETTDHAPPAIGAVKEGSTRASQHGDKESEEKFVSAEDGEDEDDDDGDESEDSELGQEETFEDPEEQTSASDSASQSGDDIDASEHRLDLLGQEVQWEKVLKSARSVYKAKLASEIIRNIVMGIRGARLLYEQLLHSEDMDRVTIDLVEKQLNHSLHTIQQLIAGVREEDLSPSKRSEVIRDIYSCAIPKLVFLLKSAFSLRASQPRGLHDHAAINEIVLVQNFLVQLCTVARLWKAKPNTDRPIKKLTSTVILPYIRYMRDKVFAKKRDILWREEKARHNRQRTMQKKSSSAEQDQREFEELSQRLSQQVPNNRMRKYVESYKKEQEHLAGQKAIRRGIIPSRNIDRSVSIQHVRRSEPAKSHEWTVEEKIRLVALLEETQDLPNEDRWLAALNVPDFQEMLPEHVRQKALSLKDELIRTATDLGLQRPWMFRIE